MGQLSIRINGDNDIAKNEVLEQILQVKLLLRCGARYKIKFRNIFFYLENDELTYCLINLTQHRVQERKSKTTVIHR